MRSILALLFAIGCSAWGGAHAFCLSDQDAITIGNNWVQLTTNYTVAFANATLAPDMQDQADSVITLADGASQPQVPVSLGTVIFPSRAAFEAGQVGNEPIPFEILNTWHDCSTVIIRWRSAQTPQQVQGFNALIVEPKPDSPWHNPEYLIKQIYGEFNSGAWLVNFGNPQCKNTTTTEPH